MPMPMLTLTMNLLRGELGWLVERREDFYGHMCRRQGVAQIGQ